jgi:hypothetical protein
VSTQEHFAAIKAEFSRAVLLTEGGLPAVYLPSTTFRAAGSNATMDLLLFPSQHSGYATRLFFERPIRERSQNWAQHCVVARTWWAPSFQGVAATLSWPAMVFAHLRAIE